MIQKTILLVEDSPTIAKVIIEKISTELKYKVIVAATKKQAVDVLSTDMDIFLALLDLNLPDAPNGEIVDIVLEKNIPSIVLTGNLNLGVRKKFSGKDIIDFLLKNREEDLEYLVQKIKRLEQNINTTVLLVDDSILPRSLMRKILEHQLFTVVEAKNGVEGLAQIKKDPTIKIVVTDFNMPHMNGLELTKNIRENYTKDEKAIIAVSVSSDENAVGDFLKFGATDFIKKPFSKDEFVCRINNIAESMSYIETINNMATRDYLTQVYNRRYFFEKSDPFYEQSVKSKKLFAVAMFDIDDFKKVNDTYGHAVGDIVIKDLANALVAQTKGLDIVSRFGGEEFCLLIKDVTLDNAVKVIEKIRNDCGVVKIDTGEFKGKTIKYTFSCGVTIDYDTSLAEMINTSDRLLYDAKQNGKNRTES